jgi:hypothetical protein
MASVEVVQELFEKKKSDETDDNTLDTGSIVRNLALYNLVRRLRKFPKSKSNSQMHISSSAITPFAREQLEQALDLHNSSDCGTGMPLFG